MKTLICIAVLALAGCLQSNISGASNGSPGSSGQAASGATGLAGSPASSSGSVAGTNSGGQLPTGTGNGPGDNGTTGGPGGDTGSTGGFNGTGGFNSTGGFNGTGSFTGGAGTGGFRGTATNGGTGGRRLPDAGPCVSDGTQCGSSDECCSGACAGYCTQGAGEACFIDSDCVSYGCDGGACLCSPNDGVQSGPCGTSQDCCDQGECTFEAVNGYGYGRCCNDLGSSCESPSDCCDGICGNGQCQCQPAGTYCYPFNECCSGICTNGLCQSGPGGPCSIDTDCTNENCVGGTECGTCGNAFGACSSDDTCCSGLTCASPLTEQGGITLTVADGGPACCQQAGAACEVGFPGETTSCCGKCDNGTCACVGPTGACAWDIACCSGGACMVGYNGLACCQISGQTCFSGFECCTGFCGAAGTCACMPDGGSLDEAPLGAAGCCHGAAAADNTCL